jgi:peptidyl-prolyl cis-trans isomerase C
MGAVVLHGVEIPDSLIAQEAQNHPGPTAAASRTAAAHALATKALLLRRAADLGLEPMPERDEDGREETAEAALVRAVLEAEIEITPPTEQECRRVYDAQRASFRSADLYEASHILIEPAADAEVDVEAARIFAQTLAAALTTGESGFAELARSHSACPSGATGGSLGQLRRGDLVGEVEAALLALTPRQMAPSPVRSRYGWHLLRLDRHIAGRDLPFEIASEAIRLRLESRAWTAAATRYVVALAEATRGQGVVATLDEEGVRDGSLCLGDMIGDPDATRRLLQWLEAADPHLLFLLLEESRDRGSEPPQLVQELVAEFVGRADDENWTRVVSAARDGDDPAHAALAAVLKATLPKAGGRLCKDGDGRCAH